MAGNPAATARRIGLTASAGVLWFSTTASASHGSTGCSSSSAFTPLFELLHSITELAFLLGVGLATFGFAFAGLCFMIPGQEWNRRGKLTAKNVLIGTIILMSANMVVTFLIQELGGVTC